MGRRRVLRKSTISRKHRIRETTSEIGQADTGVWRVQDVGGISEGFYEDDQGRPIQITKDGALNVPAGVTTFLALTDTPSPYVANRVLSVNAAASAVIHAPGVHVLATGELLVGTAVSGGGDGNRLVQIKFDSSSRTALASIENRTDGTLSSAGWRTESTVATGFIQMTVNAPGFTPIAGRFANEGGIQVGSALSSFAIITEGNAPIRFAPNKIEAGRILGGGDLAWGRTTLLSANDIAVFSKSLNANVRFVVTNPNTGNSVSTNLTAQSDSGVSVSMGVFGSGHISVADVGQLTYTGTVEFRINASAAAPITFLTTATERARFLEDANTLQGNAGLKIEGGAGVHVLTLSGGASAASSIAIGIATEKIGLYGVTAIVRGAVLTAEDATAIDATYDAVEQAVLNNVRTRVGELEARLQGLGAIN